MKKITYENQGAETLLVCQLDTNEHIDEFAKGMLQSNTMTGISRPSFIQRDMNQYLKFSVTSKIPLKDYLQENMEKQVVLKLFVSIVAGIQEAEEYMLDRQKILLSMDYIFVDISKKETSLLYLPVDEFVQEISLKEFLLHMVSHMRYEIQNDVSYVGKLIHFLNDSAGWNLSDLQRYIKALMVVEVDSISSFINEQPQNRPVEGLVGEVPIELCPTDLPVFNDIVAEKELVVMENQEENSRKKGLFGKKEKKKKSEKEAVYIPGIEIPGIPPVETKKAEQLEPEVILHVDEQGKLLQNQTSNREKKKRLFGFRKQKKETISSPIPPSTSPKAVMPQPNIPPSEAASPMQLKEQKWMYGGQGSSDDDNRTVIMGGGEDYGATVILGQMSVQEEGLARIGQLIRRKNGQVMAVNKEVFHIGREGSFSDFYIGDNPAIGAAHADIFIDQGQYFISDRNSVNHTYVNGVMVAAGVAMPLKSGDIIKLADEEFDFKIN